jgi:RimJ/RimL family protein N-acetyltransferase
MILQGNIVTLRPLEEEDLDFVRELFNDPEIESMVVGWSWPVSKYQHRKWYEKISSDFNTMRFIVETKKDGVVGVQILEKIDWKNRVATTGGIKIGKKKLREKGIGFDTGMTLFRYLFDELQMNRVDSCVMGYNSASIKLVEKQGYKLEGVRRRYIYKNGKYHDLLIYGLLREDYDQVVKNLKYWKNIP